MAQNINENTFEISPHRNSKDILPKVLPKKINIDYNGSKWFSKPPSKKPKPLKKTESKSPRKSKKMTEDLRRGLCSPKKLNDLKLIKKRKYLSPSAKLESKIPKVADLLREWEETKKLEEIDKLIKKSSTQFYKELREDKIKFQEKPKHQIKEINCKHLTLNLLNKKFRKDVKHLDGIFSGKIHSKRHDIFQEQLVTGDKTLKGDLRICESMGAFTSDQLIHIVSLFRERYDNGNRYKHSDYYFKVLLPEYCLKIFMDCHKMSHEKALQYLKNMPVPNIFGLF